MGNKVVVKGGTSKDLTADELVFLKKSSKLSEKEIKDLHEAFWNEFPGGRMDKKGFVKYYQEIKDEADTNGILCDHVFAVFDQNHDGTIDFREFLLAVAAGTPGDLDSHLDYVFEMCDVSGDGHLDAKELANFLSASLTIVGKTDQRDELDPKRLAGDVFRTLGISEDQKLTKEQFVNGCKNSSNLRVLFGGGN
ncbi:unnamed protein product [Adineta ricciae]|uniref:EF-hand domain-containing protein n=1 Tax=Adineta ricciae TaxID=249248 RepID=A0A814AKV4_ADIRI|nr:unnamed protein product [Adineta ricciae]